MGYRWQPRIRVRPQNGVTYTVDLTTLSYVKTPAQVAVSPEAELDQRKDVDRVRSILFRGWHHAIRLEFIIGDTMADHATLVGILNALARPEDYDVDLSLDAGATWRQVILHGYSGLEPLGGKTHVGAQVRLDLDTKNPDSELVPVGTGTW